MRDRHFLKYLAVSAALFSLIPPTTASQKRKKTTASAPQKKPVNLVWPLPPERPRIKYLTSISSNVDVEPPKKRGWLQKLINEDNPRHVIRMVRPSGIAVDSKDRVYVADTNKGVVFVFDQVNKTMALLGNEGRGRLQKPFGIAIDNKDNVYVSDTKLKAVNVYNAEGKLTASLSKIGKQKIVNPTGLALDKPRNRLLIVDSQGHKIFVADLTHLGQGISFGKLGSDDNDFYYPSYVAVDKQGRIYVTDTMNFCVKIFDKNFKFLKKIGEHGTDIGMFDRAKGIALDSKENIYVVDMSFSNFQIFDQKGQALLFVGAFGTQPGEFRMPSGIYIDEKDRIYVSDQINKRIQIFQFLGGH